MMNWLRTTLLLALLGLSSAGESLAQAGAAPQAAARTRRSWTADRREFGVGDVLTVMLDEYTLASANKTDAARDLRSRDMDLGVSGAVNGTALPAVSGRVGSINDADSRQDGDALRQNRFQGEMTVRVTEIDESGLLRVEGKKVIALDKDQQEVTLTGLVRPADVATNNLVDSWRIADVQLVYTSTGGKPRGGILGKILGAIWP